MKTIFVDTSGWGSLVDSNQAFHSVAREIYEDAKSKGFRFVTTNYVIAELVALLSSPLRISRNRSISFIDRIKVSALVEVIHISAIIDARSWELLSDRLDKNWSLVDCSSFVIMNEMGIQEALTTDHHFEQAGLVRLLR